MRGLRSWRCLLALLLPLLASAPGGAVIAQGPTPPAPAVRLAQPPADPALPAAPQAVLYDQINSANGSFIYAQDSTDNQYDTQAADDFFVSPTSNSWRIDAVEVSGYFTGSGGSPSVNLVNVAIYADGGGLPGYQLTTQSVHPISGTASTGNFYLPLSPPVRIASNATYWVAVQAVQSTTWNWYWKERATQSQSASTWQNPNNGFATGCVSWESLNHCFVTEGPDLLFRLYGVPSSDQVTPVLLSLSPDAAIHRAFTLAAHGIGFANGAKLDWNLGAPKHIATTLTSSTNLTALVPAADVPGPYGGTLTVTVTNPGPCGGTCISNALTFTLVNRTQLPLVRR